MSRSLWYCEEFPLDQIDGRHKNIITDERYEALKENIATRGMRNPVILKITRGLGTLIANPGARRVQVAKDLGRTSINAMVYLMADAPISEPPCESVSVPFIKEEIMQYFTPEDVAIVVCDPFVVTMIVKE